MKMVYTGAVTTAKKEIFIELLHKNCYIVEGINLWLGVIKIW